MTAFIRILLVAVVSLILVTACSELPFPATTSENLSLTVAPVPSDIPSYDRDEWRHWIDEDRDCQDTRQEVLIEESSSPVEYEDSDQCRVAEGEWDGPYTGEQFTDPSDLDVDHMVPLGKRAPVRRLGLGRGQEEVVRQRSLLRRAPDSRAELRKPRQGRRRAGDWRPPDRGYWCQYAIDWIRIKQTWKLTATEAEADSLSEMLNTCSPRRTLTTVEAGALPPTPTSASQPTAVPTPAPASEAVYDSCDEAEAASEQRVQGSQGDAQGFPASMVPSAGDGDGDGVVCET